MAAMVTESETRFLTDDGIDIEIDDMDCGVQYLTFTMRGTTGLYVSVTLTSEERRRLGVMLLNFQPMDCDD